MADTGMNTFRISQAIYGCEIRMDYESLDREYQEGARANISGARMALLL